MDSTSPRIRSASVKMTVLAVVALALAACNPGAASTASQTPTPTPGASAAAEAYEVTSVKDAKLGAYLAGEDGKTLYVFTKDTGGKSVCNGDCAKSWPPFVLAAGETVKGAAGVTGTFGTVIRDDGSTQVTYGGAPLYYFAKDAKAGDANGQGVGGVWFVAATAGGPGGAPASSAPSAAPSSGGSSGTGSIYDFGFDPGTITVAVGTTVTWTNTGQRPHTVTADDSSFDSPNLGGGQSFSQTFAKAGTFAYHCKIHPDMKGTVVVQ